MVNAMLLAAMRHGPASSEHLARWVEASRLLTTYGSSSQNIYCTCTIILYCIDTVALPYGTHTRDAVVQYVLGHPL